MKDLEPFRGVKLERRVVDKLKRSFTLIASAEGKRTIRITRDGGIHWSGRPTQVKTLFLVINRARTNLAVEFFEYPHGLIMHPYVLGDGISNKTAADWNREFVRLWHEVKTILTPFLPVERKRERRRLNLRQEVR